MGMSRIKNTMNSILRKGAADVVIGTFLQKLIMFLSSILFARLLSKDNLGIIGYAESIVGFVLLINACGLSHAQLRYAAKEDSVTAKLMYYRATLKMSIPIEMATIIIIIGLGVYYYLFNSAKVGLQLFSMVFIPGFSLLADCGFYFLRSVPDNRKYAFFSVLHATILIVGQLVGYFLIGLTGIPLFKSFGYLLSGLILLSFIHNFYEKKIKRIDAGSTFEFTGTIKKAMWLFGLQTVLVNLTTQASSLIDTYLVGTLIKDFSQVGMFKVASTIPMNLSFIPSSVAIFFFPYFSKNEENTTWLRRNIKRVVCYMTAVSAVITTAIVLFTPLIIQILYGEKYLEAIPLMRVLMISFFFRCAFRIPLVNILPAIGFMKYNLIRGIVGLILQLILDFTLIPVLGVYGAAVTTVIVDLVISGMCLFFVYQKFYKRGKNHA